METNQALQSGEAQSTVSNFKNFLTATATSLYFWIIFGTLTGAALFGIVASWLDPVIAVALGSLPLLLVIIYFLQARLYLAPIPILIAMIFFRLNISTGTNTPLVDSMVLALLFAGLWVLRSVVVKKKFELYPFSVNKPILGFMIVVIISMFWSLIMRDPLVHVSRSFIIVQFATATAMILLPGMLLYMGNHVTDMRIIKIIVGLMLVAGFLGYLWDRHVSPIYINTNGLYTLWSVCFLVGLALFNSKLSIFIRGLFLLMAGLWIYYRFGLKITWVSGWLPTFAGLFVLAFMRSKKIVLLLVVVLLIIIAANLPFFIDALEAENSESGGTRLSAWGINWQITREHLLFGTGPGGYAAYYGTYFSSNSMATHSNYLDILSQLGIIGFAFYIWIFVSLGLMGFRLCRYLRGRHDYYEALANISFAGTIACAAAMFFGDWLIPFPYTQGIAGFDYVNYSWIFMSITLVLDRKIRDTVSFAEKI
jgi:hypothetical protein